MEFSGYYSNTTDRHDLTEMLLKVALNTLVLIFDVKKMYLWYITRLPFVCCRSLVAHHWKITIFVDHWFESCPFPDCIPLINWKLTWKYLEEFEDTKGVIRIRKLKKMGSTMDKRKSTTGQTTIYKPYNQIKLWSWKYCC
jgi:hypothetical protein